MRHALLLAMLLGACRSDPVKCDQACRNYATLVYWKAADTEIAAAPADKRAALRQTKLGRFNSDLEAGVDMCVSQCQSAGNEQQNDCLIAAKTADQATACLQ